MRLRLVACLLSILFLMACSLIVPPSGTPKSVATPLPTVTKVRPTGTINLQVRITDGQQPVKGTIRLYWPDTGGELTVGPTSEFVFPIPADSSAISVTVTAPGFLPWSQMMTPAGPSSLTVRLLK